MPGPGLYKTRVDSCRIRSPEKASPCFQVKRSHSRIGSLSSPPSTKMRDPTREVILQRRKDIQTPFVAKKVQRQIARDPLLGPGEYKKTETAFEFCKPAPRSVIFTKTPHLLGRCMDHEETLHSNAATISSNVWPRPEFASDALAESNDFEAFFWKREKLLNREAGDDDDDDDDDEDDHYK